MGEHAACTIALHNIGTHHQEELTACTPTTAISCRSEQAACESVLYALHAAWLCELVDAMWQRQAAGMHLTAALCWFQH